METRPQRGARKDLRTGRKRSTSRRPALTAVTAALVAAATFVAGAPAPAGATTATTATAGGRERVEPIRWASFREDAPDDAAAQRLRNVLLNSNRYALQTWFPARFGSQTEPLLNFGGIGEHHIRPAASEALALATSLRTDAYDAEQVGVPRAEAEATTLRLVRSLAGRHKATSAGGWGDQWQSALWAYWAGSAGWLVWDKLTPAEREHVRAMVTHEADRFIGYAVPYYRDADGAIVSPGDTKAEENAWNSAILSLATAMMPHHEHWRSWTDKAVELMVSSYSRPADLEREERLHGKAVRAWLRGSNAEPSGAVINHGKVNPDYQSTITLQVAAAVQSMALANEAVPSAAVFNADANYETLVDHVFASPPFQAPGGTIYLDGSPELYFPQGADWGTRGYMHFALLDVQAAVLGLDEDVSTPAAEWEALHADAILDMQARFADGRTYAQPSEWSYAGREEFVAVQASHAYLLRWLDHQDAIRFTDRAYPIRPDEEQPGRLTFNAPDTFTPGEPNEVSATLENDGRHPMVRAVLTLDLPEGWQAEDGAQAGAAGTLPPGAVHTATWTVTPPAVARPAQVGLVAQFRYGGEQRQHEASRAVRMWASADDAIVLTGTPDQNSADLALGPAGWSRFLGQFPNGVDFAAGADDPRTSWSYIHPGPRDRWAGSRSHRFVYRFHLDEQPTEDLAFTMWLLDVNHNPPPAVVTAGLNGGEPEAIELPPGGGDGHHWGDGRPNEAGGIRPTSVDVLLPADQLRPGENVVTLERPSGPWIVYDAVGVRRLP